MTTTAINLPTWCQLRAERFRDMEQHEMAMYPDQDCRDVAIVEHVVRVLANPDLPESSEVLAIVAEQHRLELNATGTAEWAKNRIKELTAELDQWKATYGETALRGAQQIHQRLADALDRAHRAETDAAQMTRANQEITAERDRYKAQVCLIVTCSDCGEALEWDDGIVHFRNLDEAKAILDDVGWRVVDGKPMCAECLLKPHNFQPEKPEGLTCERCDLEEDDHDTVEVPGVTR